LHQTLGSEWPVEVEQIAMRDDPIRQQQLVDLPTSGFDARSIPTHLYH
jgi:hypothetical protein